MNLRLDKKTNLPCIHMDTRKSMMENSYDDLYALFIKKAIEKGITMVRDCNDTGCSKCFKIILNK